MKKNNLSNVIKWIVIVWVSWVAITFVAYAISMKDDYREFLQSSYEHPQHSHQPMSE